MDVRSNADTILDEFINFQDESKITGAGRTFRGTRTIVFRTPPGALATFRSGVHSNLRVGATPFVPRNIIEHAEEEVEEDEEPAGDEDLDLTETEGNDASIAIENSFKPLAPPTSEEICAASRIQRWYRHYHSRQSKNHTPEENARQVWYKRCLALAVPLRRTYKLFFLGPLPHVLVSLQLMNRHAHGLKKSAKKKMLTANTSELEEVDKRFSETR